MAEVKLENVNKVYEGGVIAASNVSIEIHDKEFVVLVGPSGCGKSTTLRMIAGLEEITSGNLFIDGEKMNDVPPKDRDIAMVFQNYALYPHMTVRENMSFGLKLRKMNSAEIERRVSEVAEVLGLTEYLERKPKALSGGQRQRVALGRAIVRKPKVFLFDEPLSNLDAKLRVQMRTEISKLHHTLGSTMIYVTHDQVEAMTMGDKIVVMKSGFVQQIDSPLNLYNSPVNKFVAGFIGSPAMNFVLGSFKNQNGVSQFVSAGGSFNVSLSKQQSEFANGGSYTNVWLGIRPEDIYLELNSLQDKTLFSELSITLEVVEPMGNETFIYFTIEGVQITARVSSRALMQHGDTVKVYFDSSKTHYFDAATEQTILR